MHLHTSGTSQTPHRTQFRTAFIRLAKDMNTFHNKTAHNTQCTTYTCTHYKHHVFTKRLHESHPHMELDFTRTHTHTPHNALFPPYMNDMHAFHTTPNTKYILKLLLKKTYIHCTQMASIHYPYHTNYNRYKPYAYGHISQTHAHITYLYTQQHTPNTQNLNVPTNPHYTHCTQI